MSQQSYDPTSRNPYEDGDPIPVPPRTARREVSSHERTTGARTRSRQVQSAREAATRRHQHASGQAAGSHLSAGGPSAGDGAASGATRQPRPVRPRTQQAAGRQTQARGGYEVAPRGDRRRPPHPTGQPEGLRRRRKMGFGIIAGIIIAAIAVLATLLWWINRPVPITVNGEAAEVRVSSKLADVLHEQGIEVTPGDYVSVSDRVLAAGRGNAFTAAVNGKTLTPEEADDYRVVGNEAIEYSDGTNICEEFDATSEPIMPRLRIDGDGYSLQYISQWGYAGELQTRTGKESGEVADVVTTEPTDCVVTCIDPYLEDQKVALLTFDDGPLSPYTEQYLDILASHGVHATFFNLGENVQANPDLARRIVETGNELANHTMAHNQLTAVDADTIYREITTSASVIEQTTGVKTTHIRPPYGDFTSESWLASGGAITASIRWTADSLDWQLPGSDAIVANSLANTYSGMIILMHDGGGDRSQDVGALPSIIEQLQGQGYQFMTVAELMRALGIPEEVASGTGTMPEGAVWPTELAPAEEG